MSRVRSMPCVCLYYNSEKQNCQDINSDFPNFRISYKIGGLFLCYMTI